MAKGTEYKLWDYSYYNDGECGFDSACESLLDWMSFSGYCPDYSGEKFLEVWD
jgi:hypothetical protein